MPSVALLPSVGASPFPPTPKLVISSSGQDWGVDFGQQEEEEEGAEGWQGFEP